MMGQRLAPIIALVVIWEVLISVTAEADVCNCQYTIPNDWEPNCRVFGHANDKLVAFERASQSCIDQLSLAADETLTYSNEEMWQMCPLANGTNANVLMVMNELQFSEDKSTAVREIRSRLPEFFQQSSNSSTIALGIGLFELKDLIYDARTSPVDCQVSPRNCWSAIREFVTVNETLRALVCTVFHIEQQMDNAMLQWYARLAICEGTVMTDDTCEPLKSNIANIKSSGAGKECSSIFTRPNSTVPLNVSVCDFENPIIGPSSQAFLVSFSPGMPLLFLLSVVWGSA